MIKRLKPREKMAVGGALLVLGIILGWLLLVNPYLNTVDRLERKISTQQQNLRRMQQMQGQISQLQQQLATVDRHSRESRPLFSLIESLTGQIGIRDQLLSMRPQPTNTEGEYRQQLVEIRLEKITLGQVVKLLYAIEYRSGGVQVKSLRVKPRFEDRSSLDLNMVLMSLEKP